MVRAMRLGALASFLTGCTAKPPSVSDLVLEQRLDERTWRTDLDEARRALATERELVKMVAIVKGG
jgi:hypothetical protein